MSRAWAAARPDPSSPSRQSSAPCAKSGDKSSTKRPANGLARTATATARVIGAAAGFPSVGEDRFLGQADLAQVHRTAPGLAGLRNAAAAEHTSLNGRANGHHLIRVHAFVRLLAALAGPGPAPSACGSEPPTSTTSSIWLAFTPASRRTASNGPRQRLSRSLVNCSNLARVRRTVKRWGRWHRP